MVQVNSQGPRHVEIIGDATIHDAETLYAGLVGLTLDETADIEIDMRGLEALDVAGVQILVAFRRHWGAARMSFRNLPAHVLETLRLGGMGCILR
jgi:anti-anti-sigma regulatory factor